MDRNVSSPADEMLSDDAIHSAFQRRDPQVDVPAFHKVWADATRTSAAGHNGLEPQGSGSRIFALRGLLAVGVLLIAGIWLFNPLSNPELVQESMTREADPGLMTVDPNRLWYGPTDELLQVGVLRYETQWPVYEQYYSVTVEIH